MAFIDYTKYNFCASCVLEFSKKQGTKCPQCHHQARTIPRNPKKFRDNKIVFPDSQIWMTASSLQKHNSSLN